MVGKDAKKPIILTLFFALLLSGCGKSAPEAAPVTSSVSAATISEPISSAPPSVAAPEATPSVAPGATYFATDILYEWHDDEPGSFRLDIVLPMVAPNVANGDVINARIEENFAWLFSADQVFWQSEKHPYTWVQFRYTTSCRDGICSLTVIQQVSSLLAPETEEDFLFTSYYYDENAGEEIPTAEEYITRLGYSPDDILAMFHAQYEDRYDGASIDALALLDHFYFDETGNAVFSTYWLGGIPSS